MHVRQVQRGRAEVAPAYLYPRVHLEVVMCYSNSVLYHAELILQIAGDAILIFWFKLTKKLLSIHHGQIWVTFRSLLRNSKVIRDRELWRNSKV